MNGWLNFLKYPFKMESCEGNNVYVTLLSRQEWCDIIAKKLQTSEFDLIKTNIAPLSEDQMGFMGDHLKLNASVLILEGNQKQNLQYFAKSVPIQNKVFQEYVNTIQAFKKKTGFFSNLLPDLKKYIIQRKEVVENEDNSSAHFWTCDCYLSKPEIIVLEDLVALGFEHTDSRCPMEYDHCILVLQTLARFHAASVIVEEKQPKTTSYWKPCQIIDTYQDIFCETEWVITEGHPGNKFMKASIKGMVSMLEHLPKYGRNYENFIFIREKLPQTLEQMYEFVKPSEKFRNVVCHGDLWVNNIFFQYEKNKPTEVRFVVFQLIRYNPPASEVMWFLHLVTRKDFREMNMDVFLTTYYQCFSSELHRHHLDPDQLLSWYEFSESCDFYRNAGRMEAALYFQQCMMTGEYLKTIFSDPDHMTMFQVTDKSKYLIECYHNDPVFRDRNVEVVEELIEYCILNK
jgi:hypothetical protein